MKKWFFAAVITSFAGFSLAQATPPVKKAPASAKKAKQELKKESPLPVKPESRKTPIPKFSMGMVEGDRIDAGFVGASAIDLINAIEKRTGQKKGEFESTADFNARKVAALSGKILGESSVEDTFAFVLPVGKGGQYPQGLTYSFDPDTGLVRLYVLPASSSMNGIGAPDYQNSSQARGGLDLFDMDSKIEASSTYQGSNAYGATVSIEKTSLSQVGIAANRMPFLDFKRELFYLKSIVAAQFNMENSRAATELPTLKAMVVMKLADPYLVYHFNHKEPKRDSPTDITMQKTFLTGDIQGIIFYSSSTGEIFLRLPAMFGKPESKPEDKQPAQ